MEPDLDTRADRRSTAYLFVEDADALAETWLAAGGDVRLPQDTEWGQHEGVLVDPDGNVIRFGSPMSADPGGGSCPHSQAGICAEPARSVLWALHMIAAITTSTNAPIAANPCAIGTSTSGFGLIGTVPSSG